MPQLYAIQFDVAAVIVMLVTLASLILRGMTRGATNRVYLTAMVLVTITALASLGGGIYDAVIMSETGPGAPPPPGEPPLGRDAFTLVYFTLGSVIAPTYLILIATVSGTTNRLNTNNFVRICLWTPMIAVLLLVLTNPFHHLVYFYVDGRVSYGPLISTLCVSTAYYSVIGIGWLFHWRKLLNALEFYTLLIMYPIVFVTLIAHFTIPGTSIEMFITSVAMMLISAFVIRPERRLDTSVNTASLYAYRTMCQRAFAADRPLCLVYLEIVNLERLRELFSKDELQSIVRGIAANLSSRLERDDTLYYLRNGLFCISPRNIDPTHAVQVAQRAHEEGRAKSEGKRESAARMQMRTCIVRVPEDVSDIETLNTFIRRFAHLVPESCVTTYSELSSHEGFALEMALSDIIADAIEEQSFEVHYQPIWHLASNRPHSAEALIRLRHPEFGWIQPGLFVPVAEQNGTIIDIGAILFDKVCAFLERADFEELGLEYVEVNLSMDQCVHPGIVGEFIGAVKRHGVDPRRINLEVTETSSAYSQEAMSENVRALAEAGFTFSLDDYGTGYSSVERMLSLPFSLVKLDQSFVKGLDDPSMRIVAADTIAMVKAIGKDALIEGVETQEQADELAAMGVDYIQGYYFSKPLPEDEFTAFLREHNRATSANDPAATR